MARLIRKEDVGLYGGDTVYLETKYGGGLVSIVSLSYREDEGGDETIHSVEWSGFDNCEGDYGMDDYGVTWRLWDVYVETPSAQQMAGEPWEVY